MPIRYVNSRFVFAVQEICKDYFVFYYLSWKNAELLRVADLQIIDSGFLVG
jgi:hypothetical protein